MIGSTVLFLDFITGDFLILMTVIVGAVTMGVMGYLIYLTTMLPSVKALYLTSNRTMKIINSKIEDGILHVGKNLSFQIESTPYFLKDRIFNKYYVTYFVGFGNRRTIPVETDKKESFTPVQQKLLKKVFDKKLDIPVVDKEKIVKSDAESILEEGVVNPKQTISPKTFKAILTSHFMDDLIKAGLRNETWSQAKILILFALIAGLALGFIIGQFIMPQAMPMIQQTASEIIKNGSQVIP